jgi:hypothetical protein
MRLCLVATMALVLSACGSKDGGEAGGGRAAATKTTNASPGDESVAAVQVSQGTPLAQLRFVIAARPEVGKTFRLQLIVAGATGPALRMALQSEVLRVDPAEATLDLSGSGTGTARTYGGSHDFMVVGAQEGLAEVTVRLAEGEGAPETVYSIPVLVTGANAPSGAPPSDKPDPAAAENHGKPENR